MRAALAALVCLVAQAAPRLALACSVCTAGRDDEANRAFVFTTIFLSALPLSMFAGFGLWVFLRHRKHERALVPVRTEAPAVAPSLPELS